MSTKLDNINKVHSSELYLYFYDDFLQEEATQKQCDFITQSLSIQGSAKILDLACGHGRHSLALQRRGHQLIGIDINSDFIKLAQEAAQKENLAVDFIESNILDINYREVFDGVLLLFNSFGFFSKADAVKLLKNIYDGLKPGGRAILDVKNRDHLIKELKPYSVIEKEENLMIDRLSFDPIKGTTTNNRSIIKGGKRYDMSFTMFCYNYNQLEAMCKEVNLKIEKVFGSWNQDELNQNSRRIILVLQK